MEMTRLKVAIIGGGISGLSFAISLKKFAKDIQVNIYESAREFAEIGAGIGIWPRGWEVIRLLCLEDDLRAVATVTDGFEYRKSDQPQGVSFHESPSRVSMSGFLRADFQKILCKHLPVSCQVHFSKKLVSYTRLASREMRLHFADGTEAICDLVVGCDGVYSMVRDSLYRELARSSAEIGNPAKAQEEIAHTGARWSGTTSYRALILSRTLQNVHPDHRVFSRPMIYFGKNKHIVAYTVQDNQLVNIAAFVHDYTLEDSIPHGATVDRATKDDLLHHFANWEPEVAHMISCVEQAMLWQINVVPSLPTYTGEHVVLLGDAAHGMAPHQGAGAGQGLEDAFTLAKILAHQDVTVATLSQALQVHNDCRHPFTQNARQLTRHNGLLYSLNTAGCEYYNEVQSAQGVIPPQLLEAVGKAVDDNMQWQGQESLAADCEQVLRSLDTALSSIRH